MPPQLPRFSVLVANYNHAALVGRAVDSVLAQTYPAALREVIVVDDGSTDASRERLAAWAATPGVKLVFQDNRGQTAAFAAGLQAATGDYICLLDADDTCAPTKLAALAEHIATLATTPEQLFLCHDLDIVDGVDGAPIPASWFEHIGQHLLGSHLTLNAAHHGFPFAVTSGMAFGRKLLARLMAVIPLSEWAMGSDAILGHTALLLAGEVHYLRRRLGSYVVHGDNDNATIVAGRYTAKDRWHLRRERTLMFLDLLVESLPLTAAERAERWGYVARLAHASRTVALTRSQPQPLISLVVDAQGATPAHCQATADAAARLRDCHHELVWVGDAAGLAALPEGCPGQRVLTPDGADAADDYPRLRAGHAAARGSYLCFLAAGDCPDPLFGARHLHAHRHGSLPMFTASDLSLIDGQGALVHSGILATATGWAGGNNVIPAFGHSLRDWPLAPLPALLIRRTPMLDAFFAAERLALPPRLAGWLLSQYLLQLGGGARLQENLMSLRLPAGATPNASWLSRFISRHGPPPEPDYAAAAEALLAAYLRARRQERAFFSEAWEARFLGWLLQGGGAQAPARLEALAEAALPDAFATRALQLLRQRPASR